MIPDRHPPLQKEPRTKETKTNDQLKTEKHTDISRDQAEYKTSIEAFLTLVFFSFFFYLVYKIHRYFTDFFKFLCPSLETGSNLVANLSPIWLTCRIFKCSSAQTRLFRGNLGDLSLSVDAFTGFLQLLGSQKGSRSKKSVTPGPLSFIDFLFSLFR